MAAMNAGITGLNLDPPGIYIFSIRQCSKPVKETLIKAEFPRGAGTSAPKSITRQ